MASQPLIICFTDLKDSTAQTEQLGNEGYLPGLNEHLMAGEVFAKISNGDYIKNIGDAHLATFAKFDDALHFATLLQEFCADQPNLSRSPIGLKIGIGLGAVEATANDVFGAGVNEGARIQGKAIPGQILLNEQFQTFLKSAWGASKVDKYVTSLGDFALTGINNPPEQELFSFDWKEYARTVPSSSLASLVLEHLKRAQVETNRLNAGHLANPGSVIWPVVPRDIVTAIHQGQVEMLRLLALLGWRINLMIADCAAQPYEKTYSQRFANQLNQYLLKRDIKNVDISYMSDLYAPSHAKYERVQQLFKEVSSKLTLSTLLAINNKAYDDVVKKDTLEAPTLDCLRPALTLAAVLFFATESQRKAIVVSGYDEEIQWETAYTLPVSLASLGVLMNPILNDDEKHQARQQKQWPHWLSERTLRKDMDARNLAWWTFHLHVFLPAFPAQTVLIANQQIAPELWPKEKDFNAPQEIDKDALAKKVWHLLEMAT